jgi:RecB family exonuclease
MVLKEIITRRLLDEVANYYPPFEGEYYPSQLWKCLRQQYYERTIPHLNVMKFGGLVLGTVIHDYIADLLKEIEGAKVLSEVPIRIPHPEDEGIVLSGRADDVIVLEVGRQRYVVEVKTIDDLENALRKGWVPKKEHVAQLNVYLRAFPNAKGILLYVDRSDFEMEEFEVNYDPQLFKETLDRAKTLHYALKNKILPEPEAQLNPDMSWNCRFCPFASICERDSKNYRTYQGDQGAQSAQTKTASAVKNP